MTNPGEETDEIPEELLLRKIVHIDMDCFYAAVEARDNPSLKGRPVVVGGHPNSRGVVATCSYEARKYGLRSAMSSAMAKKLCPEVVFVKPSFQKYKHISLQIRSIFKRYTDKIEPLSLDEAYLDVSGHELYATKIANQIRSEIERELNLTASAGVGPNKLIAKIASDINKPNGIFVVLPQNVAKFMSGLPLRKINGIGPVTEKKLSAFGLRYCRDILEQNEGKLCHDLGQRFSSSLIERCRGIDTRPVESSRDRKSISSEQTFEKDLSNMDQIDDELSKIAIKVSTWLNKNGMVGKTVTLKVKYFDFKQITRSRTVLSLLDSHGEILPVCRELLCKTDVIRKPIRLLGISVSGIKCQCKSQAPIFQEII